MRGFSIIINKISKKIRTTNSMISKKRIQKIYKIGRINITI